MEGGAFSTWAITVIRYTLSEWLRSTKGERRIISESISLSTPVAGEGEEVTLGDTLEAIDDVQKQVEIRETLKNVSRSRVGRLMAQGKIQAEIAKRLKRSRRRVAFEMACLRAEAADEDPPKPLPAKHGKRGRRKTRFP